METAWKSREGSSAPAGRRRVSGRAAIVPLAAVVAAALLAFAPAPAEAQDAEPQGRQETHQHLSQNHVQSVSITSTPGSEGFYTDGDAITVGVAFTGPANGPRLPSGQSASIQLDIGDAARSATVSGASIDRLRNWTLTYRVQQGDRDLNGISIAANRLSGGFNCGLGCTPDYGHSAVSASTTQKVLATPSAPSGFSARGGAGEARLTWTRDTGPHSSRNYQYRYSAVAGSYGGWTSAGGSGASFRTVTLAAGTYDFQLRARNRSGDGAVATASGVTVTAATSGGPSGPTGPSAPSGTVTAVVDPTSLTVIEGRSRSYQVRLSAAPSANVTVTIASSPAGVVTVAPRELTFTASDWSTQQRVTVTAAQDDDTDDGAATLSHTLSGTGVAPTGPTLRVTVTDDDGTGATVPDPLTFVNKEVGAQRYIVGTAVNVKLPAATGGTPPLTYRLTPDLPEGLSFDADPDERVLSGTPAAAAAQAEYTLTVTDAGTQEDTLSFPITVVAAAAGGAGAGEDEEATPAQVSGTALANVLEAFGGAFAADAVDVIGERFTAVGPLLQLTAPPPGAPEAGALLAGNAFAAQAPGGLAFWGRGGLSGFSAATAEGSVLSAYLGADWRLRPRLLIGGAVTYGGAGDVAYDNAGAKGKATINLGAALPYAHWSPLPGLGVWGLAGLGGGVAAVTPAGSAATETGVFLALGAVGARYDVLGWPGGSAAVKADGLLASLSAAEQPGLAAANTTPGRVRLLIEGRTRWEFMEQSWLQPVLEVGGRFDGALGAEFGGGVSYRHTGLGLGADLRGRYLLAERQEWGASAEMSYTLGESGWSFALIPEWGLPNGGAADLRAAGYDAGAPPATRLRLQAGYRPGDTFTLNVAATREEHPGPPTHALLIQGSLHL